jgi:hypothetical protein
MPRLNRLREQLRADTGEEDHHVKIPGQKPVHKNKRW